MTRRIYILVEGVVDAAFLAKILESHFNLVRVRYQNDLGAWEEFQKRFVFPKAQAGRVDIADFSIRSPEYFRSVDASVLVALRVGNGDQIWRDLEIDLRLLEREAPPNIIAIVGDADAAEPAQRLVEWQKRLGSLDLPIPERLAALSAGKGELRVGLFLFPNAGAKGTVEDLLIALGRQAYPTLQGKSESFVGSVEDGDLPAPSDARGFSSFAGKNKAVIGAMTAILKPGFATPRTVRDDGWLAPSIVGRTPEMASCIEFFTQVLGPLGQTPE